MKLLPRVHVHRQSHLDLLVIHGRLVVVVVVVMIRWCDKTGKEDVAGVGVACCCSCCSGVFGGPSRGRRRTWEHVRVVMLAGVTLE